MVISGTPRGNLRVVSVDLLERECQLRMVCNSPLEVPGLNTTGATYNWRATTVLPAKLEGDFGAVWDVLYDLLHTQSILNVTLPPHGGRNILLHLAPPGGECGMQLLQGLSLLAGRLRELAGLRERRDLDDRYDMFINSEYFDPRLPGLRIIWRPVGEAAITGVIKDIMTAFTILGISQEETHG